MSLIACNCPHCEHVTYLNGVLPLFVTSCPSCAKVYFTFLDSTFPIEGELIMNGTESEILHYFHDLLTEDLEEKLQSHIFDTGFLNTIREHLANPVTNDEAIMNDQIIQDRIQKSYEAGFGDGFDKAGKESEPYDDSTELMEEIDSCAEEFAGDFNSETEYESYHQEEMTDDEKTEEANRLYRKNIEGPKVGEVLMSKADENEQREKKKRDAILDSRNRDTSKSRKIDEKLDKKIRYNKSKITKKEADSFINAMEDNAFFRLL